MSTRTPKVSVGLPVYNGAAYLDARLDSLLGQTFTDLEVIICDNASTDDTAEICREWARRDSRVRYYRNDQNIGGFPNHNLTFELSTGEYFMWVGADDLHEPEFLTRCVEVLEGQPEVVLCYTAARYVDDRGREIPDQGKLLRVDAPRPSDRFADLIRLDYVIEPVLGLIRSDYLRRTGLMRTYPDSDRVLVAELGLHGPFRRIPDRLFIRRRGDVHSTAVYPGRHERMQWIDPLSPRRLVFPYNRQAYEFGRVIRRAPITLKEKAACCGHLTRWCVKHRRLLTEDYRIATKDLLRLIAKPILDWTR